MQYDMHYYGTYAMAVAAGIPQNDAEALATAAQFVDDQNFQTLVTTKTGEGVLGIATAHHPLEAGVRAVNLQRNSDDSRLVWTPFHFMPGNEGNTFHERLVAKKDSAVVNAMWDHYLKPSTIDAHRPHALLLVGIAAHVYADTFSHYGFSGIPSDKNAIVPDSLSIDDSHSLKIVSYITQKAEVFKAKFGGAPRLGHGAVLTYPDRPYLKWSFKYADERGACTRDNPAAFLEACEALYGRFKQFAAVFYGGSRPPVAQWDDIKKAVKTIIETEGDADARANCWVAAMATGGLKMLPAPKKYSPEDWYSQIEAMEQAANDGTFVDSESYRFFSAAEYHRSFVLKRLLPSVGLMVA